MSNILDNLNNKQKEAVTTTEGYVRVVAGAGSGKTKTLTHRYCYLVDEIGVPPKNILCATFTNKAANEMKKRIQAMSGIESIPYVCTFHSFCVKLLREDIHVINYPLNFMIIDEEDVNVLLKTVYESIGINTKDIKYSESLDAIGSFKARNQSYIKYFTSLNNDRLLGDIKAADKAADLERRITLRYILEEKKNFALDFEDLLLLTLNILEEHEDKRRKWQERIEYVMVDEFQDVNTTQYKLAEILSGYHKNLFIVGDPDQTIYSWRGAKVQFIMDFDKIHKDAKTIILDENYRSTKNVLDASNSLIEKNVNRIEKAMFTKQKKDIPVISKVCRSSYDEAQYVVQQIKKIKADTECEYSDFAILYRAHYVSRAMEEALLKADIPYTIYSGISFYQRKEIKDVLSYLRMLLNKDDISFLRTVNAPKRGFGDKKIKFLKEYATFNNCTLYQALLSNLNEPMFKKSKASEYVGLISHLTERLEECSVSDLVDEILKKTGYEEELRAFDDEERLDNLAELKNSIFEMEKLEEGDLDLATYLQDISLFTNIEKDEKNETVKLATVHSVKGLEWENVFVFEFNEGIFPSPKCKTFDEIEEERRLAYVAMTRAENRLFLLSSHGQNVYGAPCEPSRFISDIDESLIYFEDESQRTYYSQKFYAQPTSNAYSSNAVFSAGDRVRHSVFGIGTVNEVNNREQCYIIKFEDLSVSKNMSFFAKLEKVDYEIISEHPLKESQATIKQNKSSFWTKFLK